MRGWGTTGGPQPTLTGPRVRLRPWWTDDVDFVFAACQDAEIQRWTQVSVPYAREHAEGFVRDAAAVTWTQGGGQFAVERPAPGRAGRRPGRRAVAERAGFRLEGAVRQRFLHRGQPSDVVLRALLASDVGSPDGFPTE